MLTICDENLSPSSDMDHFSQLLRDLHTYLLRIRTTTEELESGPQRLKRLQTRITAAEKNLADHLSAIKNTKVAIHDHEVSLKANLEKIKKYKRDLDVSAGKKEFDALNVEIATLEKRNSDLEDETLQLMGKIEELTAKTGDFEQSVTRAKDEMTAAQADQSAHQAGLQARLTEAKQFVAEKGRLIPPEWSKIYQRLEQNGADALAALNGKSCSACYTDVTAQQFAMIKAGHISVCKSCGKLLYVNEPLA
jgi:predicted  nucleic acid-binding Zn-ribbon protein